jgi:hypothetical protein
LQGIKSQQRFGKVDNWLTENLDELGGRAVLVIYNDGKLVYNHAENGLSRKQKMIGKFIARRKGLDQREVLEDFNSNTRQPIASCSKLQKPCNRYGWRI